MKTAKKRLNLYLDEDFHTQLKKLATAEFMKTSSFVRVQLQKQFDASNNSMSNLLNNGVCK